MCLTPEDPKSQKSVPAQKRVLPSGRAGGPASGPLPHPAKLDRRRWKGRKGTIPALMQAREARAGRGETRRVGSATYLTRNAEATPSQPKRG